MFVFTMVVAELPHVAHGTHTVGHAAHEFFSGPVALSVSFAANCLFSFQLTVWTAKFSFEKARVVAKRAREFRRRRRAVRALRKAVKGWR